MKAYVFIQAAIALTASTFSNTQTLQNFARNINTVFLTLVFPLFSSEEKYYCFSLSFLTADVA